MIGRKNEQKKLKELLESQYSEFAVVYGRRRIGKTFLVNETFGYHYSFHHAGVKEGNTRRQLDQFRLSLRQQGYYDCPRLTTWLEAFFELENFLDKRNEVRKVVFLDELPWMDTPKSGFLTALEGFWNGWASCRKDIVLIACGSATSWIVKNILRNSGGLYNRVRTRIKLFPFTLQECESYAEKELHLRYSRDQIMQCYMALGGVAYYWSLLERGKSPAQNFDALFFGRQDGLRTEYEELYRSLFRNPGRYMDVIALLGKRRSGYTREEIVSGLGGVSGGDFTRILSDLEECGFIRAYRTSASAKCGYVYQLIDNFTLFFQAFVKDNPDRSGDFWQHGISDGVRYAWRGFAFERVCLEHVDQIKKALGIAGVHTEVYSWRADGEATVQVDLLIDRNDGIVNLCEMKYSDDVYALDAGESERLRRRAARFSEKMAKRKSVLVTLITSHGLKHNGNHWEVQAELTMDDLFC